MKTRSLKHRPAFTRLQMPSRQLVLVCALMSLSQLGLVTEMRSQGDTRQKTTNRWNNDSPYGRLFDPQTMATVTGEVLEVRQVFMQNRKVLCTQVILVSNRDTLDVHLAPVWFMDKQKIQIQENTILEITGSEVIFEGQPVLVASQIIQGKDSIRFRNANGYPKWNRWSDL